MIPLPVADERFSRVAMDILGPLPRSQSGNLCVGHVQLCNGISRGDAIEKHDAERVAEELVKIITRLGNSTCSP